MKQAPDFYHQQVPGDYYHQAIRKNFLQRFWHLKRFAEIKNLLNDIRAKRILDVGCHGGRFTFEISQKFPQASIYGIDISPAAINFAKKNYPGINFKVAGAEKLPFATSYFDLVACFEVLEHIKSPIKVLKEIRRVLKKGRSFIIVVPTENFLFRFIWFFWSRFGPGRVWRHTHLHKFQNYTLDHLLEQIGFVIVKRKPILFKMLLFILARKK